MAWQPLRVTFQIVGGWVAPAFPLHLDAVLAYSQTQRALDDLVEEPTIAAIRSLADDLPLGKYELEDRAVWMASAIIPVGPVLNDSAIFVQRRNLHDYANRVDAGMIQHGKHRPGKTLEPYKLQLDTARGVYRNLLGFFPVQRAFEGGILTLQAWCIGNAALIEELLTDDRRPTHLGARRRSGFGRIESVQIDEDETAHEKWTLRVKPWPLREDDVPIQAAYKPPYWALENVTNAFIPASL